MKNTITLILLCTTFLFWGTAAIAQQGKLNRANKKYDDLAFIDASKIYLNVAESGYKSEELFKKLGNTFYFNTNYHDAAKWYGELFALSKDVEAIYYLRYSQALKSIGESELSQQWFDQYAQKAGISDDQLNDARYYMQIIEENSGRYTMTALSTNTSGIDFGASLLKDKLIFASTRDSGSVIKRRDAWSEMPFLDLYQAHVNEDGSVTDATKLKGDINSKFHESSAVFTKDGNTMYFTRNNDSPRVKRGKNEERHLKIYRAHWIDEQWTNIEDLSINGENYSTAHPALSPLEDKLYFVSNMPQSLGLTDLFVVNLYDDGSLGAPINLGEKINTKGRESFPYVTKENELYFSSDGHYGLGGYDVFYAKLKGDGFTGNLINVGEPVNSASDDFAFIIKNKKGYMSSNRPGGMGYDDIYSFVENKPIKDLLKGKIYGTVIDKDTRELISNATIAVLDETNTVVANLKTDSNGYYQTDIDITSQYLIKATNPDYDGDDVLSLRSEIGKDREHNFELSRNPSITEASSGTDLPEILNIAIYFDLDRSLIRPDAEVELEKIVSAMKLYPHLKIAIASHTDSRDNDSYNKNLSERRAQSTLEYLVNRGIDRNRLAARGYGESRLINNCSNGVECSEKQHQKNRRSEFIIANNN